MTTIFLSVATNFLPDFFTLWYNALFIFYGYECLGCRSDIFTLWYVYYRDFPLI